MKILVILQGTAFCDARFYNGLRLAGHIATRSDVTLRIFCFGAAIGCAVAVRKQPGGPDNVDRMLMAAADRGAEIVLCGDCLDARGITETMLITAARRSSRGEVDDWIAWADETITI